MTSVVTPHSTGDWKEGIWTPGFQAGNTDSPLPAFGCTKVQRSGFAAVDQRLEFPDDGASGHTEGYDYICPPGYTHAFNGPMKLEPNEIGMFSYGNTARAKFYPDTVIAYGNNLGPLRHRGDLVPGGVGFMYIADGIVARVPSSNILSSNILFGGDIVSPGYYDFPAPSGAPSNIRVRAYVRFGTVGESSAVIIGPVQTNISTIHWEVLQTFCAE